MLLFLQIVAFCQLLFLPGLLILRALRYHPAPGTALLLSVPLSGLFNYLLTLLLYPAGLFTRGIVLSVFILETGLLLAAVIRDRKPFPPPVPLHLPPLRAAALILAGTTILIQLGFAVRNTGSIFLSWDSVLSWNRWATAWADGTFQAQRTFGYPQLIPCNWAVAYKIIGEPLNFVPKGIAVLCPALISLLLTGIARQRNQYALCLAVPLTAWFFHNTDPLAGGGETDFMIAFYCFSAIGFLILNLKEQNWKLTLCAGLTAICAACAKQSGLVFLILIPVLVYAWNILRGRKFRRALGIYAILAVLTVSPYYLYFATRTEQGKEHTKLQTVTRDIYGSKSRLEIAASAWKVVLCKLAAGVPTDSVRHAGTDFSNGFPRGIAALYSDRLPVMAAGTVLILLILISAIKIPVWSKLFYVFALPYTLIWMLFYSYDLRNLMPVQPLLACGCAFAAVRIWNRKALRPVLIVLPLAGIFLTAGRLDFRRIQQEQKVRIGSPGLNRELEHCKLLMPCATDYQFLEFIPGFGTESFVFVEYSLGSQLTYHINAVGKSTVRSLLVPDYAAKEFQEDLARRLKNGEIQLIFRKYGYRFYKKTEL